jgi:hypothetical protein
MCRNAYVAWLGPLILIAGCTSGSIDAPPPGPMPPMGEPSPELPEPSPGPMPPISEPPPELPADWALHVPARGALPAVSRPDWVRNPIDHFVLAALDRAGLEPGPPETAAALIRRLSLDLRGLPPAVEEVEAFIADPRPEAYEELVDRYLADPAWGEHRARSWLDNARYADTHGFHFDNYRAVFPYRDWVVQAFNDNMPFDRFTIEQLAGDLLPEATVDQKVATGFLRNGMTTNETGIVDEEYQVMYARDRVETVAAVWLGLTAGCAACHDHRYDPITQREFYQLTAYFRNNTQPALDGNIAYSPPAIDVPGTMSRSLIMEEAPGPAQARMLTRGQYDLPGETVSPGVPAALPPLPAGAPANRLGLARWLVSAEHPLAARVNVNRFWAQVFGAGLVRTAEDFGAMGERPSHPELLDWLAVELRESGWDIKHLFRLMITSATYRQSAAISARALERDPDNRLLARAPRFRMDGEMIRDQALAASGLLVRKMGGPGVFPYQPPGLWEEVAMPESNTWSYPQQHGDALYRRSLYTFWKRTAPPPAMEIFNAPSREEARMRRDRTNNPHQALVALNDPQLVEAARVLAAAAVQAAPERERRLDFMARRVLARTLTEEEQARLAETVASLTAIYAADPESARALLQVGEMPAAADLPPEELAAWTMVGNLFFNLDEALCK